MTISGAGRNDDLPGGVCDGGSDESVPVRVLRGPQRDCRCSSEQVERYRQRISGPLFDRIDIHIEVPAVEYKEIAAKEPGKSSGEMRNEVEQARRIQQARFGKKSKTACNARMSSKLIKQHCESNEDCNELLRIAMADLNLSARAYDRILKVSRTIVDTAGAERIGAEHLSEAIQYRTLDRNLWVSSRRS